MKLQTQTQEKSGFQSDTVRKVIVMEPGWRLAYERGGVIFVSVGVQIPNFGLR